LRTFSLRRQTSFSALFLLLSFMEERYQSGDLGKFPGVLFLSSSPLPVCVRAISVRLFLWSGPLPVYGLSFFSRGTNGLCVLSPFFLGTSFRSIENGGRTIPPALPCCHIVITFLFVFPAFLWISFEVSFIAPVPLTPTRRNPCFRASSLVFP